MAFHVLHSPVPFAQLITLLHPIRLSCMLELFVFSKVHFPESTQQGTAAVEARLLILSSPDPCKETIDEKGQKDWNHFRDLVPFTEQHVNKQGRNTLCSRPFSPDKVYSDAMLHSTLYPGHFLHGRHWRAKWSNSNVSKGSTTQNSAEGIWALPVRGGV